MTQDTRVEEVVKMHPTEGICSTNANEILKNEGYFITNDKHWFKPLYQLRHREFDYPLYEDHNAYEVLARGLAYILRLKQEQLSQAKEEGARETFEKIETISKDLHENDWSRLKMQLKALTKDV